MIVVSDTSPFTALLAIGDQREKETSRAWLEPAVFDSIKMDERGEGERGLLG